MVIERGNCTMCGSHIDDGGLFLCAKCREENEKCLHGKLKEEATAMERLERPITVREPRRKLTDREEQLKHHKIGGRKVRNDCFKFI